MDAGKFVTRFRASDSHLVFPFFQLVSVNRKRVDLNRFSPQKNSLFPPMFTFLPSQKMTNIFNPFLGGSIFVSHPYLFWMFDIFITNPLQLYWVNVWMNQFTHSMLFWGQDWKYIPTIFCKTIHWFENQKVEIRIIL